MPDSTGLRPAAWIVGQFKQVLDYKKREAINSIMSVEIGVARALLPVVAGKQAPPLTDSKPEIKKPGWMKKFEHANKKD